MKHKLLIIEDEPSLAKQMKWGLKNTYDVVIADNAKKGQQLLASGAFPAATLDLGLPPSPDTPEEGFRLLESARTIAPHTKIIVITGNAEQENAIKAVGMGAVDFCSKPIDPDELTIILNRTYKMCDLEAANRKLLKKNEHCNVLCDMLGVAQSMTDLFSRIRQAAEVDYPVLIRGETGTGKEMAAKAVHSLGKRSDMPLVIINCGAIPENLLESELFGYEKGAFTGAVRQKNGKIRTSRGRYGFSG